MAYINVAEWTPDQVTDWLKGLDDSMYNYVYSFTNNEVGDQQLLNIRPYELEQPGMNSIGHQEIVLEAVEKLRNFHYNLDKENLQFLALHMATAARNLYRQLATNCDNSKIETQILNDITRTIATIKPIISWLDRAPFHGQLQFNEIRKKMLRLGLEMATSAQRDRFVENSVEHIKVTAETLAKLGDYIIQDITDPMLLQPASLSLVTLKKRESELGFNIEPSYHGIHKVTEIKYNSPAHNSGKIEDGDEIVQINYHTVMGWQYKTVILQLRESLPDVLLMLKKHPKHTKIYGQIYMQPYRLPSKKRAIGTRWTENLPSKRPGFLPVPDFNLPLKISEKAASSDTDSSCSDILTPTDPKSAEKEIRLYYPKPRAVLQRRNTICGGELYSLKNVGGVPPRHEQKKSVPNGDPSSPSLRDKSVSFGFGLEIAPRPTTCLGITSGSGKLMGINSSFAQDFKSADPKRPSGEEKSKPGVSKVVRFDANMKYEDYPVDQKYTCNVDNTILETYEPIPFADEEDVVVTVVDTTVESVEVSSSEKKDELPAVPAPAPPVVALKAPLVEAINHVTIARRGRLDKSHSTPAYDNSGEESDTPPAIEPRKEFILTTPPAPPPRPRKPSEVPPIVVPPPPPKPVNLMPPEKQLAKLAETAAAAAAASAATLNSVQIVEESEQHTPTKTKTLTLKKKNSLIAKRRKITLKILGTGDIQGHLYRRTKDKRGVTSWAKLYFVLMDTNLYGFRNKEAMKANCFAYLPGFTVSLAKVSPPLQEVHSKPFAFKVYHPSKTFYFAAVSQEAFTQWMDFIRQATLQQKVGASSNSSDLKVSSKELFSETESSGDESDWMSKSLCTPSPSGSKDFHSPKGYEQQTPISSDKDDKKYLGSLRKFTKNTLPFKTSSGEKNPSSDIPVPTDQYRSYCKVPGGSFGIQIGANTPGYTESVPVSDQQHPGAPRASSPGAQSYPLSEPQFREQEQRTPNSPCEPNGTRAHEPALQLPVKELLHGEQQEGQANAHPQLHPRLQPESGRIRLPNVQNPRLLPAKDQPRQLLGRAQQSAHVPDPQGTHASKAEGGSLGDVQQPRAPRSREGLPQRQEPPTERQAGDRQPAARREREALQDPESKSAQDPRLRDELQARQRGHQAHANEGRPEASGLRLRADIGRRPHIRQSRQPEPLRDHAAAAAAPSEAPDAPAHGDDGGKALQRQRY